MQKNQANQKDSDLNADQLEMLRLGGLLQKAIHYRCDLIDEAKAHREEAKIIEGRIPDASAALEEIQEKYNAAVKVAAKL